MRIYSRNVNGLRAVVKKVQRKLAIPHLSFVNFGRGFLSKVLVAAFIIIFAAIAAHMILSSRASSSFAADFNSDNIVNIQDLSILASNWGRNNATNATGDTNTDGSVNIQDLSVLASQWGQTVTPSITPTPTVTPIVSPVPSPTGNIINANSYASVQAAVNAAQAGDSIYIPAGVHNGSVVINNRSRLTIYGDGVTSIVQNTSTTSSIFSITSSSNIIVHDLLIKGKSFTSDNYQVGIEIRALATAHFYNLRFESIGYAAINAANDLGDFSITTTNIEVDHNTLVGPLGEHGFYVGRGSQYWYMHHNTVGECIGYSQPPHAFYIQDSSYIYVEDNYASDTNGSNGFAYKVGVDIYGGDYSHHVYFRRNTANNNFGGLWIVKTHDIYASDNVFTDDYNSAIQFWDNSYNVYVDRNNMDPGMYGIQFIFNGLWGSPSGNPTNIHLTNNTMPGGGIWGCPEDVCPAGMIVEQTGNSWQ